MGTDVERLEHLRRKLGLKKKEMASAMGISAQYYTSILAGGGKGNVRNPHLISLYEATGANPVWIMTGEGEMFLGPAPEVSGNQEPTEEDIQALYDYTLQKEPTPINLTTMQALRFRAACLRSFLENPQFNTLDQLRAVARVYLWFIAKHPNLEI